MISSDMYTHACDIISGRVALQMRRVSLQTVADPGGPPTGQPKNKNYMCLFLFLFFFIFSRKLV